MDISPSTYSKYTACAFKLQLPAEYSVFCSVQEKSPENLQEQVSAKEKLKQMQRYRVSKQHLDTSVNLLSSMGAPGPVY